MRSARSGSVAASALATGASACAFEYSLEIDWAMRSASALSPAARRHLGVLRPHDLRHTSGYRLSEASGHNRAELERRLGHANDRYLRLYTNPPDDIAANYVQDL